MNKKKINWQKVVKRRITPLSISGVFEGCTYDIKDYTGVSLDTNLVAGRKQHQLATQLEKLIELGKAVVREVKEDPKFVPQNIKDCHKACDDLIKIGKSALSGNLQPLSEKELLERLQGYFAAHQHFTIFLYIPTSIERVMAGMVEELFKKTGIKGISLADLLIPTDYPESTTEQHELVNIAQRIKRGRLKDYKEEVKEHADKYKWLSVYAMDEAPFTLKHFEERLRELLRTDLKARLEEIEENKRQVRRVEGFIEKNIKGELLRLLGILREYIYLRSYRTEAMRKAQLNFQPLLKEIARRANLSLTELCFLTKWEVEEFLKTQELLPKSEIQKRIEAYALWETEGEYKLFVGTEADNIVADEFGERRDISAIKEFKGTPANPGYGKGGARVILDKSRANEFKRGEVLVAVMTQPEYVAAMERCAAIVTDEGGVLSHAAIVSREMNIPCVIGTEIATKVLKTGDLVEVDAEKGVVRTLRSA